MSQVRSLVKNAADPEQIRKARKSEKIKRLRELDDFRVVMSSREGRRFVHRYLSLCHTNTSSFTADSYTTAFKEGERFVGLRLLGDINETDPNLYVQMIQEAQKEKDNG